MFLTIGLLSCSAEEGHKPTTPAEAAAGPPPAASAAEAPLDPHRGIPNHPQGSTAPNKGKVISKIAAAGYSYIEVESQGRTLWLATDRTNVELGDSATWGQAALMQNFTSKTLGRTFEEIYFVSAVLEAQPANVVNAAASSTGIVKSTSNSGGYSYLELDQDGSVVWLAVPEASVSVGDEVRWSGGSVMRGFTSNTLGRTFDQIIFAGGVETVEAN
jgi:hypothetical protein